MKPLILICLFVVTLEASAQNWTRTAGPVEDDVFDLCIDSNGILYAVTPLGINRSSNGGDRWTRPFLFSELADTTARITIAPNGNIILSATSGIFLSTNAGTTFFKRFEFTRFLDGLDKVFQFAVTGSGRIYAAVASGLMFSDNNGMDWNYHWKWDVNARAIAASHDTLIAHDHSNVYSTVNDGMIWINHPGIIQNPRLLKLMILPNGTWVGLENSRGLLRFTTDGNWEAFAGIPNGAFFGADVLTNGSILMGASSGVFLINDTTSVIDVSSGFERDSLHKLYPAIRFVEDRRRKTYYAATRGAGVWKSASTLLNVNTERLPSSFRVTPNPAQDRVTIEYTTPEPQPVTIKLYDILGRTVWTRTESSMTGQNVINFDAQSLLPGSYLIVLEMSGEVRTQWVTIMH